jgi:hypothetical protein
LKEDWKMETIEIKDRASLKTIADLMKRKKPFVILTDDPNFKPLGHDRHSAEIWIGAAGAGLLMYIGAGALALAFMDPEPTTKLGLLIVGGTMMVLTGGGIIITILVTRSGYTSAVHYNHETGKFEWFLQPR